MKNGIIIRQVINQLNQIDFNVSEDRHLFGDIYESILRDLQSAGNYGEFYTPRAITEFMTDIINPRLGEKVLDPACGTGGFLTCAIENIRKQDVKGVEDLKTLEATIHGKEFKPLPFTLAVTNLILHDIEVPNVDYTDSLNREYTGIRQHWLEICNLHTVVRLPNSVFQPYASVATNLLFFTKGEPTKEIWYWEHKLPEGVKSYSKTKPIQKSEFDGLKKWWSKRKESDQAWKVPIKTLEENGFKLDIKNPHIAEVEHTYSSKELLSMLHESFNKSDVLLEKLRMELGNE
jgi:type I restriction-modification system DNA methylase subunit